MLIRESFSFNVLHFDHFASNSIRTTVYITKLVYYFEVDLIEVQPQIVVGRRTRKKSIATANYKSASTRRSSQNKKSADSEMIVETKSNIRFQCATTTQKVNRDFGRRVLVVRCPRQWRRLPPRRAFPEKKRRSCGRKIRPSRKHKTIVLMSMEYMEM